MTKKPWYLGGDGSGPTLEHQAVTEKEAELTVSVADAIVREQRAKLKSQMASVNKTGRGFKVGMWVEALKKGKRPYLMAKVVRISKKGSELDLEFEDGSTEASVRAGNGRVKLTKLGSRTLTSTSSSDHGKVTYDSKRDAYHGYDAWEEQKKTISRFNDRENIRRKNREERGG